MNTIAHLEVMIDFKRSNKAFSSLSATKKNLVLDLMQSNLMETVLEEKSFVHLTQKGIHVLEETIKFFDDECVRTNV